MRISVGGCVLAFLKGRTAEVLHPKLLQQKPIIPQKSVYNDSLISYLGKKWGVGMCVCVCVFAWMDDSAGHYSGNVVNEPREIIN